jgi:hypothetical protein
MQKDTFLLVINFYRKIVEVFEFTDISDRISLLLG